VKVYAQTTTNANTAFTAFNMDRTSINPGQTITITFSTPTTASHVFTYVDGRRVNATLTSTATANPRTWSMIISPTASQTLTFHANNSSNVTNAATIAIPIVVSGNQQTTQTPDPGQNAGVNIISVTETPATRENWVQLTIVTGPEANVVWARIGTNYRRVENFTSQTATQRTWVLDYPASPFVPHTVTIGSNRTYNWTGAATLERNVLLSAPFVRPLVPQIQSVLPNVTTIAPNGTSTFTIRTNADVNFVWVEYQGRRTYATRAHTTTTQRTWTVDVRPTGTGNVTVVTHANTVDSLTGSVTRTNTITVQQLQQATIIGTPTAQWISANEIEIRATTNGFAQDVRVFIPGHSSQDVVVRRSDGGTGTGNREWREVIWVGNIANPVPITVRAFNQVGLAWTNFSVGASIDINSITPLTATGNVFFTVPSVSTVGDLVTFNVDTAPGVFFIQVINNVTNQVVATLMNPTAGTNRLHWNQTLTILATNQSATYTLQAFNTANALMGSVVTTTSQMGGSTNITGIAFLVSEATVTTTAATVNVIINTCNTVHHLHIWNGTGTVVQRFDIANNMVQWIVQVNTPAVGTSATVSIAGRNAENLIMTPTVPVAITRIN
jgi:hypothetical protein